MSKFSVGQRIFFQRKESKIPLEVTVSRVGKKYGYFKTASNSLVEYPFDLLSRQVVRDGFHIGEIALTREHFTNEAFRQELLKEIRQKISYEGHNLCLECLKKIGEILKGEPQ